MNEELNLINKVDGASPDFQTELAKQIAELAPEVVADGKIDVDKLKELLAGGGDVSESHERFGLFWPGKKRAMRAAQTPTTATLRPDKENSKDWDTTKNVFIEGDNLEVLKILQKHYHGKIKMIYIDPPYNTGNDFVYPDNYKGGLETYLEWSKQVNEEGKKLSSNSESEGRYHSNWLNMMYPRLKLARNLLTADGVILISIDAKENAHLRKVMDEIMGEKHFVGEITWESKTKSQNTKDSFNKLQPKTETILVYSRAKKARFNLVKAGSKEYPFVDSKGPYREYKLEMMSAEGVRGRQTMVFDILGVWPHEGKQWKLGKESIENYLKKDDLRIEKENVIIKIRPDFENSEKSSPFWGFFSKSIGTAESAKKELTKLLGPNHGFETVKPVALLERLILHCSGPSDIILDFFAGSATTAHATMIRNAKADEARSYILVQIPEPIEAGTKTNSLFNSVSEISRQRLVRSSESVRQEFAEEFKDGSSPDFGFRAYKLADTNFAKWRTDSNADVTELEQHLLDLRESSDDNATSDDLLTEILIKQGHSLVEQVRDVEIESLPYKAVVRADEEIGEEDTLVLAYLDEHTKPTLVQLRAATDIKPVQFIILEDAFHGDDELKTNLAQICKTNGIELWTA
ncbi:site-specific DNA-methyltransferase [Corynebacterium ulcerans]|uniref:site-specific DNA-methyltransferase n=1 Tax=Corynebacterium ulcerans TaxID=65058 RepID=UPI0005FEA9EF|nr:site-specific DNA-methyltransferase [Corynebacterium ulcerans]AKA96518.1 Hypothetical protein CUL131002_0982 [Corynebacterium ulcerans]